MWKHSWNSWCCGVVVFALCGMAAGYSIAWAACNCDSCCYEDTCNAYVSLGNPTTCEYYTSATAFQDLNYSGCIGGEPAPNGFVDLYEGANCSTYCANFFGKENCPGSQEADCTKGILIDESVTRYSCDTSGS